jgi:hypothetical protein
MNIIILSVETVKLCEADRKLKLRYGLQRFQTCFFKYYWKISDVYEAVNEISYIGIVGHFSERCGGEVYAAALMMLCLC